MELEYRRQFTADCIPSSYLSVRKGQSAYSKACADVTSGGMNGADEASYHATTAQLSSIAVHHAAVNRLQA